MSFLQLIEKGMIIGLIFVPISLIINTVSFIISPYPLFSLHNASIFILLGLIFIQSIVLVRVRKLQRQK